MREILSQVEPIFDLVGKLDISVSKRKEYSDFCKNVGFTTRQPYQRRSPGRSSSTGSSRSYSSTSSSSSDNGGCYIATMVYGSYDAPEVLVLRDFRDRVLLKSQIGKIFVKTYYKYSPNFVKLTKNIEILHTIFRNIFRGIIKLLKDIK